jgi:hypothetical protein
MPAPSFYATAPALGGRSGQVITQAAVGDGDALQLPVHTDRRETKTVDDEDEDHWAGHTQE